jgi:pimeloyl-ACP methyl ester carboxylesterase
MRLHTTTVGDGSKRAALVHGITGDGGTWFELAPWIAEHDYTVTLVDQRGHGGSRRAATYTSEELANDLVETLPVGLDLVLGHSLGGRSLGLAVDRLLPRRAVYLDPGWTIPDGLVVDRPLREDGSVLTVGELAPLRPGRSRSHVEQEVRSNALFDPAYLAAPNWPLASIVPPTTPVVPSLVLLADPSAVVPAGLAERLRAGGYTVRIVPGGHHDLHVDDLDETKRALEGLL